MQTGIIYHSVFRTTEQYARWISEAIGAELVPMKKSKDLSRFERVIVMSGTYASGMPLVKFLTKRWPDIRDKAVVVVAVGAAPADDPYSKVSYEKIPAEIREHITYFKIRGATPFANKELRAKEIEHSNLEEVLAFLKGSNQA